MERTWRLDRRLLGLALAMVTLCAWLPLRYPLFPGLERGRANWATLGERSLGAGLLHAAVYGLLLWLYVLAIQRAVTAGGAKGAQRGFLALIWGSWLAQSAVLLWAYPGESLDIFDYLFRGRMLAEYGASPLAQSPSTLADQPFYRFLTWRGQVDTYGPLWEYASGGVARVVGGLLLRPVGETTGALAAYVIGYRLLAVGATGLCGVLIISIAGRHAPVLGPAALLAWLWNPLLLTASAVGAHNDTLLTLWLLATLWLLQRSRWAQGLLALFLAAHVKLTALLLLPVVGLWLVRRAGWARASVAGLLALVWAIPLSWLLYAPLGSWATLPRMLAERTRFLAYAPADLFYRWLQEGAGWAEPDARRLATLGATLLFCLVAAGLIVVLLDFRAVLLPTSGTPPPDDEALWRCGFAVTVAYLLIGSFWLMPWYGLWALPLAALLPASPGMRQGMAALTLGLLWSGLVTDTLTFAVAPRLSSTAISWASVVVLLAPLAVVWARAGWGLALRWSVVHGAH